MFGCSVVTEGEIHDEGVEEGKGEGFDVMHADDGVSSSAEHDHAGRTRVHSVFSSHGVHSEPEAAAARNNNTLGCTSGDAASPDHMKRTWDALENKSLRFRLNRPHAKEPTATMLSSHMFLRCAPAAQCSDEKVANRNAKAWDGATENAP